VRQKLSLFLAFCLATAATAGWINVRPNFNYVYKDVFFVNQDTGWVVGLGGKAMRTYNGGASWSNFNSGLSSQDNIFAVCFINDSTGLIAGEGGKIYRTVNRGNRWTAVTSPAGWYIDFRRIYFLNADTGFICGTGGVMLKTINGGTSWTQVGSLTNPLWDISFIGSLKGWTAGYQGASYKTTDGGAIWSFASYIGGEVYAIHMINENIGLAACGSGVNAYIKRTENGGTSWTELDNIDGKRFFFLSASRGYLASGSSSHPMMTIDSGRTWHEQIGDSGSISSVFFLNNSVGYAVGSVTILKTTDGGGNIAVEKAFARSSSFDFNVVPNPLPGRAVAAYVLAQETDVSLEVFDTRGVKIISVASGHQTPGAYQVPFTMPASSKGVYFCRLTRDRMFVTKKVVLVR